LFSFGEDQKPAGLALVYDWVRLKVLFDINTQSARIKDELADEYAIKFQGKASFPTAIKDYVDNYVKPFATGPENAQLQKEFDSIQDAYAEVDNLSIEHFRKLIRWAMDSTSIEPVRDRLKRLTP
jgi:hypothetical protein